MLLKIATQGKHLRHIHIPFSASLSTLLGGVAWKTRGGGGSYATALGTRLEHTPPSTERQGKSCVNNMQLLMRRAPSTRTSWSNGATTAAGNEERTRDTLERKTKRAAAATVAVSLSRFIKNSSDFLSGEAVASATKMCKFLCAFSCCTALRCTHAAVATGQVKVATSAALQAECSLTV